MQLQPYLYFSGECEEALAFYLPIFNGRLESVNRFAGSPLEAQAPPDWGQKIMHATFMSEGVVFFAADSCWSKPENNNARARLCLSSADHDAGKIAFDALADGGTVTMAYERQFWGASLGILTDRFGIEWMINAGAVNDVA